MKSNQGKTEKQIEQSYIMGSIAMFGMAVVLAGIVIYEAFGDVIKFILFKS